MSKGVQAQNFDHLFVLDFEATCLRDQLLEPQEIIELPCLRVCTDDFSVKSTFHRYVRCVRRVKLAVLPDFSW
jgi:inhibitor of KinA sporulation pathway (predicted exonuclease)